MSLSAGPRIEIGVISFDIDGTLENGDPPGPVSLSLIQGLQALGFLIGSCSDRTLLEQRAVWDQLALTPDFVARKTELPMIRERFLAHSYVHVGDTTVDESYAKQARFDFYWCWEVPPVDPGNWPDTLTLKASPAPRRC